MSTAPPPRIDRDKVLASVNLSDIVGQYQQIYRAGHEFKTVCPFHDDSDPSLTINDGKRFYHCFVCGAHGTAIDWIQHQHQCDFKEACEKLGYMHDNHVVPLAKAPRVSEQLTDYRALVIPDDVRMPDMAIPEIGGNPLRTWPYRDERGRLLGFVARYPVNIETGKKEIRTWTWGCWPKNPKPFFSEPRWRRQRWPRPYPLYGLWKLSEPGAQDKRITIVSGEKAADAAQSVLPADVVLTWVGGDESVEHADWSPIAGRGILLLWPDADESGRRAMQWIADNVGPMMRETYVVSVDDPELEKGWDIADGVEEQGWGERETQAWLGKVQPDGLTRVRRLPKAVGGALVEAKPAIPVEPEVIDLERPRMNDPRNWSRHPWSEHLILGGEKGDRLIKCEYNAAVPMREMDELKGLLRFNAIRGVIEITRETPWGDPPGEWRDSNLVRMCQWFNLMGYHMGKDMMQDAVDCVSQEWTFNPIADYLVGLQWDGTPRLAKWLHKYTGCEDTEYASEVGLRWMVSGAARGMRPGCQVDTMLVLEGAEGVFKTSLLRELGGEYFTPLRGAIGGSDGRASAQAAQNWLIEIGEMDALNTVQFDTLKDYLSTRDEIVRLPWRRNHERLRRCSVFAGTTNKHEWLPPDGDHRRFWPVLVRYCDIDGIIRDRDQLWAEARHMYENGQKWWVAPAETHLLRAIKEQRDARRVFDEWHNSVIAYLDAPMQRPLQDFTLGEIANGALFLERNKLDRATQMRLGKILGAEGWTRWVQRRAEGLVRVWRRPER